MDDRRKEPRKKLMAFTLVFDAHRKAILGYLGDLTLQGAMVISEHAQKIGLPITLAIEFPGQLEGIAVRGMAIPARVARCVPDEAPNSFKIGFEFTELDPNQAKMIQALLERYHFSYQKDLEK